MSDFRWARGVSRSLHRLGVRLVRDSHPAAAYVDHFPRTAFESTLFRVFPTLHGVRFVQVGANDGRRADPISPFVVRHHWRGVMLEPLPKLFAQLERNYPAADGLVLIQAALDAHRGERPIYSLDERSLELAPDWAAGLASLDRSRLVDAVAALRLPETSIVAEQVATVTWDDVWRRLPEERCDLLVMDTEGYDLTLLRLANLAARRPRMIQFEHACTRTEERLACYEELLGLGYELATDGPDTTAWLR